MLWHLRTVLPRQEVLLFTRKAAYSIRQADHRDMFKKALESGWVSTVVVSPDSCLLQLRHSRQHTRGPC
jgi:hypothetical protein